MGTVVDSPTGQEMIRHGGLHRFLMDLIEQAPYTKRMLQGAKLVSGPLIVKDWSYVSERVVGDGYILVGDAACFVDPLFSSGVHLALMSGVLAAAYVTTALKDASMRDAAGCVYRELYYKEYGHFREMAKLFYSSNRTSDSYFWEARRLLEADSDPETRDWLSAPAYVHTCCGRATAARLRARGAGSWPNAYTVYVQRSRGGIGTCGAPCAAGGGYPHPL